ncbi:MAG: substrate-binding domain-containing protein [Pseudomonadota bacterium]
MTKLGRSAPPSYSRRQVLHGAAALTAGVTTAGVATAPAFAQRETPLQVLEWGGYEGPDLYREYLDAGNAQPNFVFMSSDLDTVNKLRAGLSADLSNLTNNYFEEYYKNGLIEPWDVTKIPRYNDILPSLKEFGMRDGQQYCVPSIWGYETVIYNADKVDVAEEAYALLFDDRYAGRIAWWDQSINVVLAGLHNGVDDAWDMSEQELADMTKFLAEKKKNVRYFWTYFTDWEPDFISGGIQIAYGFPASWLRARAAGVNAVSAKPKEGRLIWVNGYVQLKGTQQTEKNYQFVNAWLSPETAVQIVQEHGYGPANGNVDLSRLDPTVVEDLSLDQPDSLGTDQMIMRKYLPNARAYSRAWDRVKAS